MKQKQLPKNKVYIQKIKLCMVREKTKDEKLKVTSPEVIAGLKFIKDEILNCDREKFLCLHLDTRNNVISYELISIGSLSNAIVHQRETFKSAILSNAASVIFCHNHSSSGDVEPSMEDIRITRRLREAGKIIGIKVRDHIVFGHNIEKYYSFNENGLL